MADRYIIPYSILEGLKAGISEWQRARQSEKEEIMMKAMMGIPLTDKEKKRLRFEIPRGLTQMGQLETTERTKQEDIAREQARYEEAQRIAAEKEKQRIKEEQRKYDLQIKNLKFKLQDIAIKDATSEKWEKGKGWIKKTDWMQANDNYQKLLSQNELGSEPLPLQRQGEVPPEALNILKYHFLRRQPGVTLTPTKTETEETEETMSEEEYFRKYRR